MELQRSALPPEPIRLWRFLIPPSATVPWTRLAMFIAPARVRSSDASIVRSETVEKLHVQRPGLPFQVASICTLYACCGWSDCFGMRQTTPNWPNDVAGCSGSERKDSMGLPAASVSFAETPVTLSNGGNCSVIA